MLHVVESRRLENHLFIGCANMDSQLLHSHKVQSFLVDGRNIAPVGMVNIRLCKRLFTSQVVQDFWTINSINHVWLHPMSDVVISLTLVSSLAVHFGDGPFFQVRPNPSTLRKIAPWRKEMSCSVWCYLSVHGLLCGQIKNESIERNDV